MIGSFGAALAGLFAALPKEMIAALAGLALLGPGFPWWTLTVNVAGSFLIGLLAGLFGAVETGHNARLFLVTGFLGGFTTFSAFSLDALTLWERGAQLQAGLYVAGSVIASLIAAAAGLMASRLM